MPKKKKAKEEDTEEFDFGEEKPSLKERAIKAAKIIFGALVFLLGLFLIWIWWPDQLFQALVKTVIVGGVLAIGALIALLGWTD